MKTWVFENDRVLAGRDDSVGMARRALIAHKVYLHIR
jgi:hypothetical protein